MSVCNGFAKTWLIWEIVAVMSCPFGSKWVMVKLLDDGSRLPPHALGAHLLGEREGASSLMIDSLAVVTGSTPRKCYQSHLGCIGNINPKYIYIFISVYPVECDNTKTNVGQYVPLNNRQQACRTRPLPSIQSTCNMQIGMCISRIISMVLAETQLHVLNISSYTGYLLVINPLRSGSHTYNLLEYPWKSGV